MPSRTRSIRFWLIVAVLIVLLGVLATLQYRWIGEVSDAERERARTAADAAVRASAAEVDRELGHALRENRPPGDGRDAEVHPGAEEERRFGTDAHSPKLVAAIFRARRTSEPAGVELERFDRATGSFSPSPWPDTLTALRSTLEAETPRRGSPPGPPPVRFVDAPPAVVAEDFVPPAAGARDGAGRAEPPASWTIFVLDRPALEEALSSAVARHFAGLSDYDVAVVRSDSGAVFYRTRAAFDPASVRVEAAAPILRPDPFSRVPFGPLPERPDQGPPPGIAGPAREPAADYVLDAPGHGSPPGMADHGGWQLVVAHRAGSLQAAVAATRARNLAVSAGILALLAATVAVLLASAHRDRRLAARQVEFVAGLTHELRTPLAAVRSAGQNLADGIVDDREHVRSYGALIHRESQRLSVLIEDALSRAGISPRRVDGTRTAVRLDEVLVEAVEACGPLARERNAAVVRDVALDLPPVVGDRDAMRTVFENLVSNAIKYGGEPARVTVRAALEDDGVAVDVRDNGTGIPKREIPRIFEPFYRGSGASERAAGTGVGLALVRRIVEEHGGRISVESDAGSGATFRVVLPAAGAAS